MTLFPGTLVEMTSQRSRKHVLAVLLLARDLHRGNHHARFPIA